MVTGSLRGKIHGDRLEWRVTGGAGYADCWDGDAEASWRWRDTMYQVDGPAVAELQHAFNNNCVTHGDT